MKTKTIPFRTTIAEAEKIQLFAEKEGMSISEAIRSLIGEKLFYSMQQIAPDFTNNQKFRVGQKVEFYSKNKKDKFFGTHTVKKTMMAEGTQRIQTDISRKVAVPNDLFIHVHWFRALPGQGSTKKITNPKS